MASFRVIVACFWNGSIRTSGSKVTYIGGKSKLFVCNSNMGFNDFKRVVCSKTGIDPTRNTVKLSFKYCMSGEWVVFPVEDDDSIDAMWEHSKANSTPSLELYVEVLPRSNQALNVTSNPSPTPMPIVTQKTQNPSVPSPSSTPSNDATVNLRKSTQFLPRDDGNESNELIDSPFEDDVDVDKEALANDMTLSNIPTIVPAAPGPHDPSVLHMQDDHRSSLLWDAQVSDADIIYTRHPDSAPWEIDTRIIPYLQRARLYDFHLVAYGRVDRAMVTALVERWRQETHTFHLPLGEATVTLLDVAVLTRLPIEGAAVSTSGRQLFSWPTIVERVLGVRPPNDVVRGSSLKHTWLASTFSVLPEGADEGTVERYAKAYLLYLIGAVLFADKTSNQVQILYLTLLDAPWEDIAGYSWGSGALGYLYRRLCNASRKHVKEISGPLIILQLWAYEHILIGQPMRMVGRGAVAPPPTPDQDLPYGSRWSFARRTKTHTGSGVGFYRDQLDLLRADQFRWDPYPAEAYAALPQHSGIQTGVWRASVPLICFDIVEVHLPERVMRQFGMVQVIPPPCDTEVELHHSSRKGTTPKDWSEINGRHIARWNRRLELLAQGAPIDATVASTSANYMPWYLSITRRWMTPRGFAAASQYAPAVPVMTQFTQGAPAVIQSSHEQPVREIAHDMLHGTQFQHFILEVAKETSPTTHKVQPSSPAQDVHLEEVDLSDPLHGSGSSRAGSSQYQSPPLPEQHTSVSSRRRRKRPSQSERVQEEDDN